MRDAGLIEVLFVELPVLAEEVVATHAPDGLCASPVGSRKLRHPSRLSRLAAGDLAFVRVELRVGIIDVLALRHRLLTLDRRAHHEQHCEELDGHPHLQLQGMIDRYTSRPSRQTSSHTYTKRHWEKIS